MEGDYLKSSQYSYHFHILSYNSYPSLLGTTRFLTSGIRAVGLDIDKGEQGEFWKELQQMVNKVSEGVKTLYESNNAILEKFNALAKSNKALIESNKALFESNKAMNKELSRLQDDLENLFEEELQLLEGTSDKFQVIESTKTVLDNEDVSLGSWFIGLEVEHMDEHVLMQMGSIGEVVLKDHPGHIHILGGNSGKCQGSNASIAFPYNEICLANDVSLGFLRLEHVEGHQELSLETTLFTILSTQGKQRWQRNATFTGSTWQYYYYETTCALQLECKEVNATVPIGCCYNSLFDAEDNTEARCGFSMSASIKSAGFLGYATLFWVVVKCLEIFDIFDGQDALAYWISGQFPLMKVSLNNNTLWARCFEEEENVRNAMRIWIIIVVDLVC